jgi:hypothetical protein
MPCKSFVLRLRLLRQSVLGFIKQTFQLPRTIAATLMTTRGQIARDAAEAERLDRLRHPSDYVGR